jgi:heme-degrading monooxygenase HmoA
MGSRREMGGPAMYVVMNVLEVPAEFKSRMADMFGHGAQNMAQVPGCLEFQFLESTTDNKQVVYTKWESEAAFDAWRKSDAFARAHSAERSGQSPAMSSHIESYVVVHHT